MIPDPIANVLFGGLLVAAIGIIIWSRRRML